MKTTNLGSYILRALNKEKSNNILWEKTRSTIIEGINDCVGTWWSKHCVDKSVLIKFKGNCIDKVYEKVLCPKKHFQKFKRKYFSKPSHKIWMISHKDNFEWYQQPVYCHPPIGKAYENVVCICQRIYVAVLINKMASIMITPVQIILIFQFMKLIFKSFLATLAF